MKKWIGLVTSTLSVLTSSLIADEVPASPTEAVVITPAETAATPEVLTVAPEDQTPKQVGKASADSTNTAKNSSAAKYVLAAGAVAIGVAAIILISRHHGHHHHHHGGGDPAAHSH
jgi:hypothetical protein